MTAVKSPQQAVASSTLCSIHGSLLTLATLTLISFTYISLKSLHSPFHDPSFNSSPPPQVLRLHFYFFGWFWLLRHLTVLIVLFLCGWTVKVISRVEHLVEEEDSPFSDIYHSPEIFRLNYREMEKNFKVYIYPDGDPNTFYQTPRKLTGKYASEGYFFQNIRDSRFRTNDPDQAHLFFIPISCHKMRGKVRIWSLLCVEKMGTLHSNSCLIAFAFCNSLPCSTILMRWTHWVFSYW